MDASIVCDQPFEAATLARVNVGPLFEDYELVYRFAERRQYAIRFRFWKHEPMTEVAERFSLGMGAHLTWRLNPKGVFDSILSRDSSEGDNQPTVEPLAMARIRDVLCRLQMPVLTEYFIPNNRGWFALLNSQDAGKGMLGVLGLYGSRWMEPVANMPEVLARGGAVEWGASLCSGSRHFLLYAGPVQTAYTAQQRLVFHRLHAQFNAMRLDEHLDLTGEATFDEPAKDAGFFGAGDYHAEARKRFDKFRALKDVLPTPDSWMKTNGGMHLASFRYLLEPTAENAESLYGHVLARFERWVRQFQGHRTGEGDYMKNVIGFSRYLRGLLLAYEMLRRDGVLNDKQTRLLNSYFVFAARRITDEGRWPHSKTPLHPDHPESVRDFYAYGGEHRPDRLWWTNALPNFQSDPLCALAHLGAIFRAHPDAAKWRRFALNDLDGQLDAYCGKSGAWEESINYALYTFSYFVITFRALKAHCGIDYFNDERVRRYAAWLVRFLGPNDKRWGKYTFPGIGNSACPSGGGEYLLCFAGQLADNDPLRADLLAVWNVMEPSSSPSEHYPVTMAALAPNPDGNYALRPLESEWMDELGVSMRDRHLKARESYLFQKIGFVKDHYESDESSFNWYAKGTPLCMDYGTYTGDVAVGGAHNIVEIPDEDPIRRGYLKSHYFTPMVDFTHSECPVVLKLLWGRVRSFAEVENKDGKVAREKTPYFYIGDKNPVGPKTWKVRLLMFVKPDYLAIFDRVYGDVPHRWNLHVAGSGLSVEGDALRATGDFDLDLLGLVQHPRHGAFDHEIGRLVPNYNPAGNPDAKLKHAQSYWRLYNRADGVYRTLLFAQERGRDVSLTAIGEQGMKVVTPEYTDYVFISDKPMSERVDGVEFEGSTGWIRRDATGRVSAMMIEGDRIAAFGVMLNGRGPWSYNVGSDGFKLHGGPPRPVTRGV